MDWFASGAGGGTGAMPAETAIGSGAISPPRRPGPRPRYGQNGSRMQILVADDDIIIRRPLTHGLTTAGHQVVAVADGVEALAVLDAQPSITLVISDWMMPEMSGLDPCRQIRRLPHGPDVHILLLTARQAHEDLSQAYAQLQGDIEAAAKMQQGLLPLPKVDFGWVSLASVLHPSSSVSGDIFNLFALTDDRIAFYALDVAGHGARAAPMSFTLSRLVTPAAFRDEADRPSLAPEAVLADPNRKS